MYHINPKYKIIGHRGVAGLRPENTYASFRLAKELGLNWIEFDVQLSKDLQWVVMHDETLDRTTNKHGKVCDYSLAELSKTQAGLWYNPPYLNEFIPELHYLLNLCDVLQLNCNIEIKSFSQNPKLYAESMAKFLQHDLGTHTNTLLISSFELPCLIELRKQLPNIAIGYLVDSFDAETIQIAKRHNFNSINCDVNNITEQNVSEAAQNDLQVLLYTVNEKNVAESWLAKGVAAVFSDRPDLILSK